MHLRLPLVMSAYRTLGIVLLVSLLAVDLVAANALVAIDRTVLNPGFVTTTLEEEHAYEHAERIVLDGLPAEELEGAENDTGPRLIDTRAILAEALDPDYLQSQLEPNIERVYAYLHGNRDKLDLVIDLGPAKVAMADAIEAELRNASAPELIGTVAGEGEDPSLSMADGSFDLVTAAEMAEDEATFHAERQAFREVIRERVVTGFVEQAFAEASNDDLLDLVIEDYDPSEYTESEKAQLVDENELEIRSALREEVEAESEGQIEAEVDEQLAETRDAVRRNITAGMNGSLGEVPPAVAEPLTALTLVAVDGYMADVSHDEFSAEFEAATVELADGIATVLTAQLDEEVPDRIDVADELDPAAQQELEEAREVVGIIDLLALVLPLVGAVLLGLLYLLSRSIPVTAMGGGLGLTIGGLPTLIVAGSVHDRLRDLLGDGSLPAGFEELFIAIAGQFADAVFFQSAVVVGLGVVAFGAGLAIHLGLVELPDTVE